MLSNLANALSIRFQRHGDVVDLHHSVELHLAALDLRPSGHPGRAKTLSDFATALLFRYRELGVHRDIEMSIEYFNAALSILPPDGRLMTLMNYASALFSRFQHLGGVSDLNDAIRQYRAVVDSSPTVNKSTSHYNLANALFSRFKLEQDPKDLELSIEHSFVALCGMDEDHPDSVVALSCFSTALIRRFESRGDVEDLQTAVKGFESALELQSAGDASHSMAFLDLADALVTRYRLKFNFPDLELAIEHYRTALALLPSDYENKGISLGNLGDALFLHFSRSGSLDDLEEAIQNHFLALVTYSGDSLQRIFTLEALGTCLDVRFEQVGALDDLHIAIDLYNEALTKSSENYTHRISILTKSASSLERRFKLYRDILDLDRSISYCREALELLAPSHPDRAMTYQVLASSLLLRFEEAGDEFDLDEAYISCSNSMNMHNIPDPIRAACSLLLARILRARMLPWDVKDIAQIFQHLHFAKNCCTLAHPLIPDVYAELASAHYLRFLLEHNPSDLHEALGLHDLSMNVASSSWWPAFHTSLKWVKEAEIHGHRSGVDVYCSALRLLDRYILAVCSPELRHRLAREYCYALASGGASFALRLHDSVEAIQALESGRSVMWSQLVRANTSLDELRLTGEYGASLADEFRHISSQLGRVHSAQRSSKDTTFLLKDKEAVVEQIRRVDGFKWFLRSTSLVDLEKAAIGGPVIILNANQHSCDALILLYKMSPVHILLSQTTLKDALQMEARFRKLAGSQVGHEDEKALQHLLSELWDIVIFPIVEQLLAHGVPKGSRLWWCPTGAFTSIPLHAAGPYGREGQSLSQLFISSYTPTLQALIRTRATPGHSPRSLRASVTGLLKGKRSKQSLSSRKAPAIVAIGHTASDETCLTLSLLRNRIPPCMSFRRIEGEEVTSETVLAAFREPVWLHVCGPAVLDTSLPCSSGFPTRDGMVSLADIAKAQPLAEFAFLSGRCSSRGEDVGLEETMHLAASLQYAGVRSVVGTLWEVDDDVMRRVTAAFYEEIVLKTEGSTHYTNTAQVLHHALTAFEKVLPLAQRIAFVHVGA